MNGCGTPTSCRMQEEPAGASEVQTSCTELQSYALRVLLGAGEPLLHSHLRQLVLGSRAFESSSRSKCLLELALSALAEQGLVVRQGYGACAALLVPDAAVPKAEALAYSEFPDESMLPLYSSAAASAAVFNGGSGGALACPPSRLARMRRHSSPRQFGRMAGIEKAVSGRRSKRSIAEDMSQLHLQKRFRLQENGFGGGVGGGGYNSFGGGVGGGGCGADASFGSGVTAMSP